ncbi:alpha/beta fold hydrolase [Kitasatospora sp. MBT63]|uniref:alpha/beta fold hydrolase n=1 Tax=Kitasatospora sp. MBT63 TaxID=1444768 RepID=UPI000539F151|nr:alpha/beta hydrolase [Kitasatospora sp. MBT63]
MTTFVLVPGAFSGAWVWEETAAELAARGHRAVPLTLPGLAERAAETAGADLAGHTAAVGAALAAAGPQAVLVAHSYGIFPAIGAVDRAPGQVARLVFVDTGIPEDGESLADTFPDEGHRDRIRNVPPGGVLPTGDRAALLRPGWGSLAGLPEAAAERYFELATPHPVETFRQPVELTGAWRKVPTTGVFCLANGLSLEVARMLHAGGEPRFAKLAEPDTSFFELPTGHYPMLQDPAALAGALISAAEGGGARLYPAATAG